jgi:hypothetical protein
MQQAPQPIFTLFIQVVVVPGLSNTSSIMSMLNLEDVTLPSYVSYVTFGLFALNIR